MKVALPAFLVLITSTCALGQPLQSRELQATHATLSRKTEVLEVMHCLKAGDLDWLADSRALQKTRSFQVGLRHDSKSYAGQEHLIVVVFENRVQGDVFDLTRRQSRLHRTYRVENNGEFKITPRGIEWPGEILGGNWTHDYMETNIRKVVRGPRTWIQWNALNKHFPQVTCTSYVSK